tara:strand:+ start:319 stop:579 length:261 start_codon:yes stop_codon:yes gene_type:complete
MLTAADCVGDPEKSQFGYKLETVADSLSVDAVALVLVRTDFTLWCGRRLGSVSEVAVPRAITFIRIALSGASVGLWQAVMFQAQAS